MDQKARDARQLLNVQFQTCVYQATHTTHSFKLVFNVYAYAHECQCVRAGVSVCLHVSLRVQIYVCVCTHISVRVHAYVCACACVCPRMCVSACVCTCLCVCA
jgi:hypothetical protein